MICLLRMEDQIFIILWSARLDDDLGCPLSTVQCPVPLSTLSDGGKAIVNEEGATLPLACFEFIYGASGGGLVRRVVGLSHQ